MEKWKQNSLVHIVAEYCCRNDQYLTWEGDASGLMVLLGYDSDDAAMPENMMNLVEGDSWGLLRQALTEQLAVGDDVEQLLPMRKSTGEIAWLLNRGRRVTDEEGVQHLVGVLVDITRSKRQYDAEKQNISLLEEQAKRDSLTKLYNTQTTRQMAEAYLAEASKDLGCALLIIDLDDFKQINDRYGHMFGDVVLVEVAQTIQKLFRARDVVGRIGGEEFLVLMKDVTDREIVDMRCRQLNEAFHRIQAKQLQDSPLSCSIGVSFDPSHDKTYFELFCGADQALYLAKDLGKDRYAFYDPSFVTERKGKYADRFADYR